MEVNNGQAPEYFDDAQLVARVQDGFPDALVTLYERHHDALVRMCAHRLNDRYEAEDVAQEAFLRGWQAIDTLQGERLFYPWLRTIATNLCNETYRRRLRTSLMAELETASPVVLETENQVLSQYTCETYATAISRLGKRQRNVLTRRASGHSYAAIASETGLGLPAVKSLILRARTTLRRELADVPGGVLAIFLVAWSNLLGSVRQAADRLGEIAVSASATAQTVTSGLVAAGPALATAAVVAAAPLAVSSHQQLKPSRPGISIPTQSSPHVVALGKSVSAVRLSPAERPEVRHVRATHSDDAPALPVSLTPPAPPTTVATTPSVQTVAPVAPATVSVSASSPPPVTVPSPTPTPTPTTTPVVQQPLVTAPKPLAPIALAATATTSTASAFTGQIAPSAPASGATYQYHQTTGAPIAVSSSGAVSLTGVVVGSYAATGTYSDASGDSGPWTFTVSVAPVPIVATGPLRALTTIGSSASYSTQIAVPNAVGAVSFSAANAARYGLVVSSTGAVTTTGVLLPGAYSISGTDTDAAGDTGTWGYTLYVTADLFGLARLATSLGL